MDGRAVRFLRRRTVLVAVLVSTFLQAGRCPDIDRAKNSVRPAIQSALNQMGEQPEHWRVHWKALRQGTVVSSFDFFSENAEPTYTCGGWCVLFFLDLDPSAHFAHPTRILVFDSRPAPGDASLAVLPPTEWWPTIREPSWPHPVSIFNTVAGRNDPMQVFEIGGIPGELLPTETVAALMPGLVAVPPRSSAGSHVRTPTPADGSTPIPFALPTPTPVGGAEVCDTDALPVWAILVDGFYDASDTFDEDIAGMYSVLRGFGVDENRIVALSPVDLRGVPVFARTSRDSVEKAFGKVSGLMSDCITDLESMTPHFLLLWSSHGGNGALACDLSDAARELVYAHELESYVSAVENLWPEVTAGVARLQVTVVIEACKSGTVGEVLHSKGPHRRILTSARDQSVSYGDVDSDVGGAKDPNPADTGSETIWGYIEAYGTASADSDLSGNITFDEAVQYAVNNDVTYQPGSSFSLHDIAVWTPIPADPAMVHGAWNTSARVVSSVAFSEPASTAAAQDGSPVTAEVVRGTATDVEIQISRPAPAVEVGALALRLFRNDGTGPAGWIPTYHEDDNIRTTVMIPGLPAGQTSPVRYALDIPGRYDEGDTMRLVVTLDSGQLSNQATAATAATATMPRSEIILKIEKKCSGFCCWWKGLWD